MLHRAIDQPKQSGRPNPLLAASVRLLIGFVICLASREPGYAQNPPQAVIVFDGSGSMWGRIGERSKFEVARDVMTSVLPNYADRIALGLIVYGHRRKSDCNDIETFAAPATGQFAALENAFERIRPHGKTPIASSLEQAASTLTNGQGGHIVVLTDGIENCRKNLCKATTALKEAAPGLTISVIGLAMRERHVASIRCLADIGGGRLLVANGKESLHTGLTHILSAISSGELRSQIADPARKVALGPPRLQLHALRTPKGPLLEAPITWRVTALNQARETVFEQKTATADVGVSHGRYRIEAQLGQVSATRVINVNTDGERSIHLPLNVAQLNLTNGVDLNPGETLTLTHTPPANSTGLPPVLIRHTGDIARNLYLPPGEYTLRRESDTFAETQKIKLKIGETRDVAFDIALGRLRIASQSPGGQPETADVLYRVYRGQDDNSGTGTGTEVARSAAPAPTFTLPAGAYRIVARSGFASAEQTVHVEPKKTNSIRMNLKAGRLLIRANDATGSNLDAPVRYTITSIDESGHASAHPLATTTRRNPKLTVPAGHYRVAASYGETNLTATSEAIVKAGEDRQVAFVFAPAHAKLSMTDASNGRTVRHVNWEIRRRADDGRLSHVWSGSARNPKIGLAPGRYEITAAHAGKRQSRVVEMLAGVTRNIAFTLP
ncbi:MAG: vWA domain-containing protein [Hyphomicrobiaceae bacterium]